jgi:cellulose synthase/poly-beta-1,6-N-acetylglucosamine synthase-like glycosyltransferase
MEPSTQRGEARLGVLVPCRNEALVIERKLRNLARARWPRASGPHTVVVVDDGSGDGTAELARKAWSGDGAVEVRVVGNGVAAGKAGAIRQGLLELEGRCELVVLSDADVVVSSDALVQLAAAFDADPRLGLACGSQTFVRDLSSDGACRGALGGEPAPNGGLYDRWTARVRALESRAGLLFSVHGQLLAWRAELGISPAPGIAADDLDLMLQVRGRGLDVRLVRAARFYECRPSEPSERERQAQRRARAYLQCMRAWRPGADRGLLAACQSWLYRRVPAATPWLAPAAGVALLAAIGWRWGSAAWLASTAVLLAALATPPGLRAVRLLRTIARAKRADLQEAPAPCELSDRWETAR